MIIYWLVVKGVFTRGIDVRKRIYTTINVLSLTAVIALMILAWFSF